MFCVNRNRITSNFALSSKFKECAKIQIHTDAIDVCLLLANTAVRTKTTNIALKIYRGERPKTLKNFYPM